jgi:pre-mRNA-processing factor 17
MLNIRVQTVTQKNNLELAPFVDTTTFDAAYIPTKEMTVNVPYEYSSKPIQGPQNPFTKSAVQKNIVSGTPGTHLHKGYVESHVMSEDAFKNLERTYHTYGYTYAPDSDRIIGDVQKAQKMNGKLISDATKRNTSFNRKRKHQGEPGEDNFMGPWAGYEDDDVVFLDKQPEQEQPDNNSAENAEIQPRQVSKHGEKSTLHVKFADGESYLDVPTDIDTDLSEHRPIPECEPPKKAYHTYAGHTKGVNAIRFLPNSAHLILSCSVDTKIKIWDVYHQRECLRTYMGHDKAVKDICFSNDGRTFLSASYDKMIKLWDTETGMSYTRL